MLTYSRVLILSVSKQARTVRLLASIICMRRAYASEATSTSETVSKKLGPSNTSHSHKTDTFDIGPIKFSTSKASPKVWTVDKSFGSHYQRPWWKVLPVSLLGIGFLIWCFVREETEIDEKFDKTLLENVPDFKSLAQDSEHQVQHTDKNKKT
ncbi:protein CCSMST1 [Protopterus annectens]|uniref:protein CCSMST1 n=1 Tax=Protopterus annectens TaxID=7888 RepID=UPI001CFB1444|nr:protein CCSMST1 [Protopterus annectens]